MALSKLPKSIRRLVVCFCMTCVPLFAQEKEQSPGSAQSTAGPVDKTAPGPAVATTVTPIQGLIRAADQAVRVRDYSTCAQLLEKVVSIDPNYKNAWNYLG